jgi:hypothetical protein
MPGLPRRPHGSGGLPSTNRRKNSGGFVVMTLERKSRIRNTLQATAPAAIVGVCLEPGIPLRAQRDRISRPGGFDALKAPGNVADGFACTPTPADLHNKGIQNPYRPCRLSSIRLI